MTDEEYVFRQTERERKRNGRGTYNKVRRGGKLVHLPSDSLTKKEREAMNGEVVAYDFSRPLEWKQFQALPYDLRQDYLDMLTEKYVGVSNALIGESMGVKNNVFAPYLSRHGLKVNRKQDMSRFAFLSSDAGKKWAQWVDLDDSVEEIDTHVVETDVSEKQKSVDVQNIAALLQMLTGTGAKITLEFTL